MTKPSCSHKDAIGQFCGRSLPRELIAIPVAPNNPALRYVCTDHYEYYRPRDWVDEERERIEKEIEARKHV